MTAVVRSWKIWIEEHILRAVPPAPQGDDLLRCVRGTRLHFLRERSCFGVVLCKLAACFL